MNLKRLLSAEPYRKISFRQWKRAMPRNAGRVYSQDIRWSASMSIFTTAHLIRWIRQRQPLRQQPPWLLKDALMKTDPVLLEPIASLQVRVPEDKVGDVMGELSKRRARIMGMNPEQEWQAKD